MPENISSSIFLTLTFSGLLILFTIVIAFYLGMIVDSFGGEDYATGKKAIQKVAEIIIAKKRQNQLLYDLGSCRGNFVFGISRACPDLKIVGIDNSYIRTWAARLRNYIQPRRLQKNQISFLKADLFKTDLSNADLIFIYLPKELLAALEAKLQQNLKPGALVITHRVYFPNWQPSQTLLSGQPEIKNGNLYIYEQQ